MDKKFLRSIERPALKKNDQAFGKEIKYLVTARHVNDDILQISYFFKHKESAFLRIFVSDDDYITQNLLDAKTKWYTGRIYSVLDRFNIHYWNYKMDDSFGFVDELSRKIFIEFFGDEGGINDRIQTWQNVIVDGRRHERHRKELAETEHYMSLVPDEPDNQMIDWIEQVGIRRTNLLVYDAKDARKRKVNIFCTHCEGEFEIDTKKIHLRNRQKGHCPLCGSETVYRSQGRLPIYGYDEFFAGCFQKVEGGFAERYFYVATKCFKEVDEQNQWHWRREPLFREMFRTMHVDENVKNFEWRKYKNDEVRWCPESQRNPMYVSSSTFRGYAIVYIDNMKDILKDTAWKYAAIDVYQDKEKDSEIPISAYLATYPDIPILEYLVKGGMTRLAGDICTTYLNLRMYVNLKAKRPKDFFRLDKKYIRLLQELNGNLRTLEILQNFQKAGITISADEERIYETMFGGTSRADDILVHYHISVKKLENYIMKQAKKQNGRFTFPDIDIDYYRANGKVVLRTCYDIALDYWDYLRIREELGYDMNDNYILFPPDLKKEHDRVYHEKVALQKYQEERALKEAMKEIGNMEAIHMRYKGLMIVTPTSADDLRREGQLQHHCVATYIDKVVKKETMIFFIRKIESPEEPYYTMEFKNGGVVQCRGKRNCDMTPDVKTFVKAFEKKMQLQEIEKRKKAG